MIEIPYLKSSRLGENLPFLMVDLDFQGLLYNIIYIYIGKTLAVPQAIGPMRVLI